MNGILSALIVLSFAATAPLAAQCRESHVSDHQDSAGAEGVNRLLGQWADAVQAGDLGAITALVTEDAEFWSNGAAPLVGREPLRAAFADVFAAYRLVQRFECAELVLRGDLAFMRGTEHNTLHPIDGGPPIVQEQRAFSVMRRGPEGTWRFWRGMTNIPPESDR